MADDVEEDKLPLTGKQRLFVKWYVSKEVNMNATEAARRAGYGGDDATLRSIASENLTKPNIAQAVDAELNKATAGASVTVESVLRKLQRIGHKAERAGQFAAASRTAELEGRYLKMFTDKIEHTADNIESASDAELKALLSDLLEKTSVNIDEITKGGDGSTDSSSTGVEDTTPEE